MKLISLLVLLIAPTLGQAENPFKLFVGRYITEDIVHHDGSSIVDHPGYFWQITVHNNSTYFSMLDRGARPTIFATFHSQPLPLVPRPIVNDSRIFQYHNSAVAETNLVYRSNSFIFEHSEIIIMTPTGPNNYELYWQRQHRSGGPDSTVEKISATIKLRRQ